MAATETPSCARPLARARAHQIAMLFDQWPRTTTSMTLGAGLLTMVMWQAASARFFLLWFAAIALNQAWRRLLVRRYRTHRPEPSLRRPWGLAWAFGSTLAGALWGVAGVALFSPGDPGHQALLIVCLFGVVLGGINLTATYKPSLYGFVGSALIPLIVRVALEGDQVHVFLATVMVVVLVFILGFGHNLNELMTQSLMMRDENIDLIAELQTQKADAERARATAEAANRDKTQFLAAASHDLRQPLHALGLFAAALSAKVHAPEVRDMVASINASIEALERLFTALMDISKLDSGMVHPVRVRFPLGPLLARLRLAFEPLAAARQLRLRIVPTEAWVESDPVLLERILGNLTSNAIRYTDRGGAVVGVRRRGETLAVDVIDSGIGIASDERQRIFEEYYQVRATRPTQRQGMGLGLAITRRLASLLELPLELRSTPGRGSRFTLRIPRAPACLEPALRTLALPPVTSLDGALVAVVDDEPAIVEGMRACFAQWGAVVVGASSGDALLAALGEGGRYPDLIVADYRLERGELGTTVVHRLRDEIGVDVPALIISGDASSPASQAMRAAGIEVLLKPTLSSELRLSAERLIAAAHRQPSALR